MDDGGPVRPLSPLTRAALALYRRPGGYVVLLGAGVSKPTGIRSAWEVLEALVRDAAACEGEDPDDPVTWWKERWKVEAAYSDVLGAVASTKEERRTALARFFERTDDDLDPGLKLPSVAHREIAGLVARGLIQVIVTLNFDHLMEQALREEGLEPTVIAGEAAIGAMEPLHAQRCAVVHLHGEYLSPELLNTPGELGNYGDAAERLVQQIADEYGLIIVGWSAEWDTRLVELLSPIGTPRFTTWWIEPGELNSTQRTLVSKRWAEVIELPADDAMSKLAVSIDAVAAEAERGRPLDVAAGVATIKRELRTGGLAVRSHDLVRRTLGEVDESTVIHPASYDGHAAVGSVDESTEDVLGELRPAAAYVATLTYWGSEATDRWWFGDLERLGWRPHVGGLSSLIELARSPSLVLAYTAGTAAVAAERWDLVLRLLTELSVEDSTGSRRGRLLTILNPGSCGIARGSERLSSFVAGIMHRHLGLGVGFAVDAWERFEYLCAITAMDGKSLPWSPWMRAEGLGPTTHRAVPSVWLDGHADVIQPFLSAPGWFDGEAVTTRRYNFDAAFAEHVRTADSRQLPTGGGFLPSSRHYPGLSDDRPRTDL